MTVAFPKPVDWNKMQPYTQKPDDDSVHDQSNRPKVNFFKYMYFIDVQLTYNVSGAQGGSVIQIHLYYF